MLFTARCLLLFFQIMLTHDRLQTGNGSARLANLAGIFQLLGHGLAAQVVQVLLLLGHFMDETVRLLFSNFFCGHGTPLLMQQRDGAPGSASARASCEPREPARAWPLSH